MYQRVENNVVVGLPLARPSLVRVEAIVGHDAQGAPILAEREVGCDHWDDATLAEQALLYPHAPDTGFDAAIHVYIAGGVFDAEAGLVMPAYQPKPLDQLRQHYSDAVDAAAEAQRLRYITGGAGQAMVYQEKVQQGRAWLAAGAPADLAAYPFIAAEIGINGVNAAEVVTLWQSTAAAWAAIAAQIEAVRLAAKAGIAAAETAAAIKAAASGLVWP